MSIEKRNIFEALLTASVLVHLDPRRSGVVVPAQYTKQPVLVLHVGMNLARRIDDLLVDEQGFSCTLSFVQQPFYCTVPWFSVFAFVDPLTNKPVEIWHDDAPPEIRTTIPKSASKAAPS